MSALTTALAQAVAELVCDTDLPLSMSHARIAHVSFSSRLGGLPEVISAERKALARLGIPSSLHILRPNPHVSAIACDLHDAMHSAQTTPLGSIATVERAMRDYGDTEGRRLLPALEGAEVVVLHDPLAGALARSLKDRSLRVVWRLHVGDDRVSTARLQGERLLTSLADDVSKVFFLRFPYVWAGLDNNRVLVVAPGIDPLSPKNRLIDPDVKATVGKNLVTTGHFLDPGSLPDLENPGILDEVGTGFLPSAAVPWILQVSRWDRHKGHRGLLECFAQLAEHDPDCHLVFIGPYIDTVRDDPRALALCGELLQRRASFAPSIANRVHLWRFYPGPRNVEAAGVNLAQRLATIVVQNSTREAFGLTATEAMWKQAVVAASPAGGLHEQIVHEHNGLLAADSDRGIDDHRLLSRALYDRQGRPKWARAAHATVERNYLVDTVLRRQLDALGFDLPSERMASMASRR